MWPLFSVPAASLTLVAMPAPTIALSGQDLSIADVVQVARSPETRIVLNGDALARLERSRGLVDQAVAAGETIYGINTGFGKLANVQSAGRPARSASGQPHPESRSRRRHRPCRLDVVRAAMLLRANVLLRPTSGVRPALVEALVGLLNAGIVPRVPEQGSVGASGDLAPLSHIAMVLLGEGEVLGGDGRPADKAARGRPASSHSVSLPRKGSASSTAPRPRPLCWRSWCTTPRCCGGPRSALRR